MGLDGWLNGKGIARQDTLYWIFGRKELKRFKDEKTAYSN